MILTVSRSAHGQPRAKFANTIVFLTGSALAAHARYTTDFPSVATVARGTNCMAAFFSFFPISSDVRSRFLSGHLILQSWLAIESLINTYILTPHFTRPHPFSLLLPISKLKSYITSTAFQLPLSPLLPDEILHDSDTTVSMEWVESVAHLSVSIRN